MRGECGATLTGRGGGHRVGRGASSRQWLGVLAAFLIQFPLGECAARADILQGVSVGYTDTLGATTVDNDSIWFPTFDPALRVTNAEIDGSFGSARAALGTAGNLGVEAEMYRLGSISTSVAITDTEIPNPFGSPQHVEANFIVDGGRVVLVAGVGSTVELILGLHWFIFDSPGGSIVDSGSASSTFLLTQQAGGLDLQTGPFDSFDLGAYFAGPFDVTIPFSLQSVALGIVPPNGVIDFGYRLDIEATGVTYVEIIAWEFSDPLAIDGAGEFPQLAFTPVPEAGSLALAGLGLGLAGVWAGLKRRSH